MQEHITIGIDLGGTNVRTGCVASHGGPVLSSRIRELGTRDFETVLDILKQEILEVADGRALNAVGVAVAGMVHTDCRTVLRAPNLDWTSAPLAERLETMLGVPVRIANDVNAITWGEYLHLEDPGAEHLAAVFFGTGVGGGLVLNRRLAEGHRGLAMEIGHVQVEVPAFAPVCGCGRTGCLETLVGGRNFALWIPKADLPFPPPAHMGELDRLAREGIHGEAVELIGQLAHRTAMVLSNLIVLADPGLLMVGGTVWNGCPAFATEVRSRVDDRHPGAVTWVSPRFTFEAGIIGVADLVRHEKTMKLHGTETPL